MCISTLSGEKAKGGSSSEENSQFSRSHWQEGPWQFWETFLEDARKYAGASLEGNISRQTLLLSFEFWGKKKKLGENVKPFYLKVPVGLMFKCQELNPEAKMGKVHSECRQTHSSLGGHPKPGQRVKLSSWFAAYTKGHKIVLQFFSLPAEKPLWSLRFSQWLRTWSS